MSNGLGEPSDAQVWVDGARHTRASFAPTTALFSNHGIKLCDYYNETLEGCVSRQNCPFAHLRPWMLLRASEGAQLPVEEPNRIKVEATFDSNESRAIFLRDSWCKKGKTMMELDQEQEHPFAAILHHACRKQKGPKRGTLTVLEIGGGPSTWMTQKEFALPPDVEVRVTSSGQSWMKFEATQYSVSAGGLLLVCGTNIPHHADQRFTLRLAGASCRIGVLPGGYEVATRHAPTFTAVTNKSESRCTALDQFNHPLSALIANKSDLCTDRSGHTWSVSFSVPTSTSWAPVLVGATIQHGSPPPAVAPTSPRVIRSIVVTPTTHRHNDPDARCEAKFQQRDEKRCHFFRALGRDSFIEVCMREEDGSDHSRRASLTEATSGMERAPAVVKRWTQVLNSPLRVNGKTYRFFTLGSQSALAYFVDSTKYNDCVRAMGVDPSGDEFRRLLPHTLVKRLRLGFSETVPVAPPLGRAFAHRVVADIERNHAVLTDGSGVMSSAMKTHVESCLRQQCAAMVESSDCSGVQYRLGAFKGTLVAARGALAGGNDFDIFKSCEKLSCLIDENTPLNVIATSKWSAGARLDKYVMTVLVDGGLTLKVLEVLGEETWATAIDKVASHVANNMGRRQLLGLLREAVDDSKKHVQINDTEGAKLMGFIDPSGALKAEDEPGPDGYRLPCVFIAQPSQPTNQPAYEKLKMAGKAVITRSPTYALSDVRVVRVLTAAEVPALDYLRDVLVFPREGSTSLPALMSGGDLDGDEYSLVWDKRVLRNFRQGAPPAPPDPVNAVLEACAQDPMTPAVFAAKCLNERALIKKLHRALLGWLLADPRCQEAKDCAALCAQEVDARALGQFIDEKSVAHLLRHPKFIATLGYPSFEARQVKNHVDAYVAAPRLTVKPWWTAVASVQQAGKFIEPYPEDKLLAAVGFPAQQGFGRLMRLQWHPAAGLHKTRVEHLRATTLVDSVEGTDVRVLRPTDNCRALAKVKAKKKFQVAFAPVSGAGRRDELTRLLTSQIDNLSDIAVLRDLFDTIERADDVNVLLTASAGFTFFKLFGASKVGHLDSTLAPQTSPTAPATPSSRPTPGQSPGYTGPCTRAGFKVENRPAEPVFLGRHCAPAVARNATAAIAECQQHLDHMAEHLASRVRVDRGAIETSASFRVALKPRLPLVTTTMSQWSVEVEAGIPAPVFVADRDKHGLKFGSVFFFRGRGQDAPAESYCFGFKAVDQAQRGRDDLGLTAPIAHLEMDDTVGAFPVKITSTTDCPPVEVVSARFVGEVAMHVVEPKTGKHVALRVKLQLSGFRNGGDMWKEPVWELEPTVEVDARDPGLVEAALASMDTLLQAEHYDGMLP